MISTDGMALSEWITGYGPASPTVAVYNGKTDNLALVQATRLLVLSGLRFMPESKKKRGFFHQ